MNRFRGTLLFVTGLVLASLVVILTLVLVPEDRKETRSPHFTFLYSSSIDEAKIAELSDALESNYSRIGDDLETTPADNIETNIYAQRWR